MLTITITSHIAITPPAFHAIIFRHYFPFLPSLTLLKPCFCRLTEFLAFHAITPTDDDVAIVVIMYGMPLCLSLWVEKKTVISSSY